MILVDRMHNLSEPLVRIEAQYELTDGSDMRISDVDYFQHLY